MSDQLPMTIYRFFTDYVPNPNKPGEKKAVDKVEFGPIGSNGRSSTIERIGLLSKVRDDGGQNPAVLMSKMIWDFIRPPYEAWKAGQELPETGTHLAAWTLLSYEQTEVLKAAGVKTVEQVAQLTDTHITRIPIPNLREIIRQAKTFLEAQDANKSAAVIDAIKAENEDLKAKVEQLAEMVANSQARRKPGRPRKVQEQAVA